MKYVAWHNGQLLPDTTLENIIAAAKRGKITEAGKDLTLYPDRRHGRPDESGLRLMRRTKQHEGRKLSAMAR
jgi:hypothetical protein